MAKLLAPFLVALFSLTGYHMHAEAATYAAASCSVADVQSAVNNAADGQTVTIPAGSCTWTSSLIVSKNVTIQGAGEGITNITDNYSSGSLINLKNTTSGISPRLTGMTLIGSASKSNQMYAAVSVDGLSANYGYRIDHITFSGRNLGFVTWGYTWGVVDHCAFNNGGAWQALLNNDTWLGAGHSRGDGAWADADNLGTKYFAYFEDDSFNGSGTVIDSYGGARYVVRYCTFPNGGHIVLHGTDSTPNRRGARAVEIYSNSFSNGGSFAETIEWRSGTGVIYNNTVSGFQYIVTFKCGRCSDDSNSADWSGWGKCDGTSAVDQNAGPQPGYRCLDQPGAGQGGNMAGGYTWPNEALAPIYAWNNTGTMYGDSSGARTQTSYVALNRDWYKSAMPGYTAYQYPYPLVSGTSSGATTGVKPGPPTGLKVN